MSTFQDNNQPKHREITSRDSHSVEPFQVLMVDLCGLWKMWAKVQTEDNVKDKTVILEKIVIILLFLSDNDEGGLMMV